jgi:penicillin amidase
VLKIVLSLMAVILLSLPVAGWWLAQSSLPQVDGIQDCNSLLKEAAIVTDDRGVPFISASSELDLYRAQGYWAASQRLFQMDMLRRLGRGELSEVFGSHSLPQDKLMRQIGFARVSKEEAKMLSADAKKALEAYSQGVNEVISRGAGNRPIEFWLLGYYPRAWTAEDSLVVMKYLQYVQEESWSLDDLRQRVIDKVGPEVASRLFEESFPAPPAKTVGIKSPELGSLPQLNDLPPIARRVLETLPGLGSNGWVVSGSGTDTGGALLALDRHSQLTEPNLWYACTLSTGDSRVAGITIPGVPGVMYGRNGIVSWGATAYKADTQDVFIEQFSPEFPNKYKTPDGWGAAHEVIEEIKCKSTFQVQNLQHKVMITRHGPVLLGNEGGSNAVVLAWSGTDISTPQFETFYRLNKVTDWNQFRNVLKGYRGAPQTFLFADKTGNIGLQIAGNVPERKVSELTKKLRASLLLPGWTGAYDWIGRMEFDQMPYSFNPKEGFLVANATNLPEFDSPVTPYPVQRVRSLLASYKQNNRRPGLPDMAVLQGDEYAPLCALVKETLQNNINKQEVNDQIQLTGLQVLDQWDGYLRRQSASAAMYESFIRTVGRRVLMSKMGLDLTNEYLKRWPRWTVQVEHSLSQKSLDWLPADERKFDTFVVTSFAQSLRDLRSKNAKADLDVNNLSWEQYHKVTFRHLLFDAAPDWESAIGQLVNIGPEGVGGDADTVNSFNYDASGAPGQFVCTIGPAERLLIDMSDADKFYETQPLGQSGHMMSPNRFDQLKSWLQAKPLPVPFSDEQSDRQQRHKVILTPHASH